MSRYLLSAGEEVAPAKRKEFVGSEKSELYNLFHLAKTALSGQDDSKYKRAFWAAEKFTEKYFGFSRKAAYLEICEGGMKNAI